MNEREKLIEELKYGQSLVGPAVKWEWLSNWIIEDRKRIVGPILEINKRYFYWTKSDFSKAIDQTLKNAGVTL